MNDSHRLRPRSHRVLTVVSCVLALISFGLAASTPAVALPTVAHSDHELPTDTMWPLQPQPAVVRGFEPPTQKWGAGNRGLDLAASLDQPVFAVAAGRVSFAGSIGGAGVVVVTHGAVRTTYTPVTPVVKVGTVIPKGTQLGRVQAGHCVQTCLNLGLLEGERYLDPMLLFSQVSSPQVPRTQVVFLPAQTFERVRRQAAEREGGSTPSGRHGFALPAAGPVTSVFGMRVHPVTGVYKLHDGTDIGAPCGTPVAAPAAGTVIAADSHQALGLRVVIDHGDVDGRRVQTAVNHLQDQSVRRGQTVNAGSLLGHVGSTGYSTGCHLHLMVWLDGQVVDPMGWF